MWDCDRKQQQEQQQQPLHAKRRRLSNEDDFSLPLDHLSSPLPSKSATTRSTSRVFVLPPSPSPKSTTATESQFPSRNTENHANANTVTYHSHDEEDRVCPPPLPLQLVHTDEQDEEDGVLPPPTPSDLATAHTIPRFIDSPLTSELIDRALGLLDRNTSYKRNSSDELLQVFHDLYRWSRSSNPAQKQFFQHEFVWRWSGVSRVRRFLKAHNMADDFLSQLLQSNLPLQE